MSMTEYRHLLQSWSGCFLPKGIAKESWLLIGSCLFYEYLILIASGYWLHGWIVLSFLNSCLLAWKMLLPVR